VDRSTSRDLSLFGGHTGRQYQADGDGIVEMTKEDADHLALRSWERFSMPHELPPGATVLVAADYRASSASFSLVFGTVVCSYDGGTYAVEFRTDSLCAARSLTLKRFCPIGWRRCRNF
jgi:hypothetical protein